MAGEFHWLDYVLFVATLALSAAIGIWAAVAGGGQKTTAQYLMGNRNLAFFPVTMSIFMSFISAVLVLGNTAEMYMYGIQAYLSLIGGTLAYFYTAQNFVPLFYRLKLTSTFVYLEKRFDSKAVRVFGNIFFILAFTTYIGVATFAPATALEGAIGFPFWTSILIEGALATFYTAIGGMKAVVWTDAIQGIIYLGGVITVLTLGIIEVGGISKVFDIAYEGGRLTNFNFSLNPASSRISFWSVIMYSFVASMETIGIGQPSVQRYCALNSEKKAKLCIIANAPASIIMYTVTCLIGLVVYAYYTIQGCDPLRDGLMDPSQLLSVFIMDIVNYPGIPRLFFAVLFAGALSTLSSGLSALATVTWKDILELKFQHIPESRKTLITKLLTVMYGGLSLGLAYSMKYIGGHVSQISSSLTPAAAGSLLGMLILGMFFPWSNKWGAMIGSITSSTFIYWIAIGTALTGPYVSWLDTVADNCTDPVNIPPDPDTFELYKLSFQWYSPLAVGSVVTLGLIISFITGPTDPRSLDPRLVSPVFDNILPCLPIPQSLRQKLYCGVPHDRVDEFTEPIEIEPIEQKEQTAKGKIHPQDSDHDHDKKQNNSNDYNIEKKGMNNSAFVDETTEL